jgi:hypothetical protein
MFFVMVTRKGGMGSTWVCQLGALRVVVVSHTLVTERNFSRLLEIPSADPSEGM